jgi:hypothetical protein
MSVQAAVEWGLGGVMGLRTQRATIRFPFVFACCIFLLRRSIRPGLS